DAWRELLEIKRTGETAKLSTGKLNPIPPRLAFIAELRDDPSTAHEWADQTGKPSPAPDAIAITGRVVDPAGKAVPGARVVTWHGELTGDAVRVYRRPTFQGDIATTDADGKFTIRGARGDGIIAELADRRSRPLPIGDAPIALTIEPTHAIAGRVASD